MRNKKGSMELSVNSIVILVIAIVVMGLVIGFIRSKFSEVSGNLITNEPEAQPATSLDTFTLSRETVSTTSGGKTTLKVNVYNPLAQPIFRTHINFSCQGLAFGTGGLVAKSANKTIEVGQEGQFVIPMTISNNAKGSYLCTVFAEGFFVNSTPNNCQDEQACTVAGGAGAPNPCPAAVAKPAEMTLVWANSACYGKIFSIDRKDIILQVN